MISAYEPFGGGLDSTAGFAPAFTGVLAVAAADCFVVGGFDVSLAGVERFVDGAEVVFERTGDSRAGVPTLPAGLKSDVAFRFCPATCFPPFWGVVGLFEVVGLAAEGPSPAPGRTRGGGGTAPVSMEESTELKN
jgi:hypothetical protein